jgi:hypothetical protein
MNQRRDATKQKCSGYRYRLLWNPTLLLLLLLVVVVMKYPNFARVVIVFYKEL